MRKVLYILTENLSIGVIKSQVISHINFIKKNKIASFTILICYWSKEELSKSKEEFETIMQEIDCKIFFLKIFRPLFFFFSHLNKKKIYKLISSLNIKFDYIHARTDYSANLCQDLIKDHKLIWDCRGDSAAEIDYSNISLFNFIRKFILDLRFFRAGRLSNKIIFVSNYLKNKFKKKINTKEIYIIPSLACETNFFYDEAIRETYRKKLRLKKNTKVFIYSGSLKAYQRFPETVAFFNSIYLKYPNVFLIVLTQDISQAKKIIEKNNNIKILRVSHNEVNNYLNAADYGIMIRNNDLTNKAASPTKFAEYCLTGLNVITTSGIEDYNRFKLECDNIFDLKDFELSHERKYNRHEISIFYKQKLSRNAFKEIYKRLYE